MGKKLERISLAFTNEDLIKNPLSSNSEDFKKKLKIFCENAKGVSLSVYLNAMFRTPGYGLDIEGEFDNIKNVLDNLTKQNLIPYYFFAPVCWSDKITGGMVEFTTKSARDYYKNILKEKGYEVFRPLFELGGNYKIVKREIKGE